MTKIASSLAVLLLLQAEALAQAPIESCRKELDILRQAKIHCNVVTNGVTFEDVIFNRGNCESLSATKNELRQKFTELKQGVQQGIQNMPPNAREEDPAVKSLRNRYELFGMVKAECSPGLYSNAPVSSVSRCWMEVIEKKLKDASENKVYNFGDVFSVSAPPQCTNVLETEFKTNKGSWTLRWNR